ncbi:MAG: Rrf2 family transcriptional regulator [bacterium]|nr:Rrf2 family transcriptional regulator [bacterium]
MKISTKGFYAVEILQALAAWPHRAGKREANNLPMTLADIEDGLKIPRDYAERILLRLKRAGITGSLRGNAGGVCLAKKNRDISLADVFAAVGEDIAPWRAAAPKKNAKRPMICPAHPVWRKLYEHNAQFLKRTTLADFM